MPCGCFSDAQADGLDPRPVARSEKLLCVACQQNFTIPIFFVNNYKFVLINPIYFVKNYKFVLSKPIYFVKTIFFYKTNQLCIAHKNFF